MNIEPTAQDGIEPAQAEVMKIIGKRMSLYGEAIFNNGKPYAAGGMGKNFILKGENEL